MLERVLKTPVEVLSELVILGFSELGSYLISNAILSRFTKHSAISIASRIAALQPATG